MKISLGKTDFTANYRPRHHRRCYLWVCSEHPGRCPEGRTAARGRWPDGEWPQLSSVETQPEKEDTLFSKEKKKIHLLYREQLHISLLKTLLNRKIHTSYMSCTLFLRFYIFACLCLYCCCSSVTCFWMSRLCKDSFTTLCTPPYKNTKVQVFWSVIVHHISLNAGFASMSIVILISKDGHMLSSHTLPSVALLHQQRCEMTAGFKIKVSLYANTYLFQHAFQYLPLGFDWYLGEMERSDWTSHVVSCPLTFCGPTCVNWKIWLRATLCFSCWSDNSCHPREKINNWDNFGCSVSKHLWRSLLVLAPHTERPRPKITESVCLALLWCWSVCHLNANSATDLATLCRHAWTWIFIGV